jgi:CRP-like cAMP-binding protein
MIPLRSGKWAGGDMKKESIKSKGTYTLRRLFPSLDEKEIERLADAASLLRVRKGQNLFISGDTPKSIYAVANGCLKISRETSDGDSVLLRILRPGQIVGIRELFGEFKYSRTVVALRESEVFSIENKAIIDLIQRYPSISVQFMKIFCLEIARLERRIEHDLYRTARARIAGVIMELHQLFSDEQKLSFEPPLSRRDIAELSDVTPETVSRTLAEFRSQGILDVQGSLFHILDEGALQQEIED